MLITPLYGDDPLYGIRELTQNAADSVREMRHLAMSGIDISDDRLASGSDIELYISEQPCPHVTITDRGTGMTLDVLKDFFLRAGASFRNSDLWKQQFEEIGGTSKIARAGRFGVGALSAFLVGGKLEVYTRHFSDQTGNGFIFSATIDEDEIEIAKEKGPVGTRIKILSDVRRLAEIGTYFRRKKEHPSFFESDDIAFDVKNDTPPAAEEKKEQTWKEFNASAAAAALALKANWVTINDTEYERVRWDRSTHRWKSWWGATEHQCGYLFCNDLLIGDLHNPPDDLVIENEYIGDAWEIVRPVISITDNNGILPLDLARRRFVRSDKELETQVLLSMWSEFIASFFYSKKSVPSEIGELWMNGDFLFKSN